MDLTSSVAFWLALFVTVFGIAEVLYKLIKGKKTIKNIWQEVWRRVPFYGLLLLILIGIILYEYYQKQKLYAGKVYSDEYLSVKIPSMFRGSFYNPDRYDLDIEITNNQNKVLLLSEIRAYFYNPRVSNEVKALKVSAKNSYFTAIFKNPGVLPPKGNKSFPSIRGPIFIPKEVEVVVSHSGSTEKTRCKFIVSSNKYVESFSLKQVDFLSSTLGIDGLDAIKQAAKIVGRWSDNARLISCIPGSHKTYIQENGLYLHQITEWILFFKNRLDQGAVVAVKESGARLIQDAFKTSDSPEYNRLVDLEKVNVGTRKALTLANNLNLIYGNSPIGWGLLPGRDNNGRTIPIWRLPYIGKDYLNIFVNADNGLILPSKEYYDYCSFERGVTITEKSKDKSD